MRNATYSLVILQPFLVHMEYPFETLSSAIATAKLLPATAKVVL